MPVVSTRWGKYQRKPSQKKKSDLILTTRRPPPWDKLDPQTLCIYINYCNLEVGKQLFGGGKEKEKSESRVY